MPKPEQTEKATPKRREEARKRGQVAKSPELAGAAIFLAAAVLLHAATAPGIEAIRAMMRTVVGNAAAGQQFTAASAMGVFAGAVAVVGPMLALLFVLTIGIAVGANLLQFGFLFTAKPITPSFSKLNPLTGFARMFSKQVVVNLVKQIAKLAAVATILWTTISARMDLFSNAGQQTPAQVVLAAGDLIYAVAWKFALLLVVVAFADYLYERRQLEQNLKMSKQEVKDELRQSEGNPEAKSAFKRKQREFARRRMMAAVPRATVVVTNPTHFAVALEWDDMKMEAPVVVAKGADLIAKRIRDVAREAGVPIMENPSLARALYAKVELDEPIPATMYAAVAHAIAFVFKLKRRTIA